MPRVTFSYMDPGSELSARFFQEIDTANYKTGYQSGSVISVLRTEAPRPMLARTSTKKTVRLADFPPSDGLAWEFYTRKSSPKREMVFSEDFIWRLRAAAKVKWIDDDGQRTVLLDDPEALRKLTIPFSNTSKRPLGDATKIVVTRLEGHPDNDVISDDVAIVLQCVGATGHGSK